MQFKHSSCSGPLNLKTILLPSTDRFADMWTNFQQHIKDPATQICGVFCLFSSFFFLLWINITPLPPSQIPEQISFHRRNSAESPWGMLSLFTTSVRFFCGAGRLSYGESPRTPPLEGTSLHRRNMCVERPWGILSLFTTCFRLRVNSQKLWHRHVCGIIVKQVVFLTVNHRGPLSLRERHPTDETCVWRDPRGSWACLRPVFDNQWTWLAKAMTLCETRPAEKVAILTVNHRGPLTLRKHEFGETWVGWGALEPV